MPLYSSPAHLIGCGRVGKNCCGFGVMLCVRCYLNGVRESKEAGWDDSQPTSPPSYRDAPALISWRDEPGLVSLVAPRLTISNPPLRLKLCSMCVASTYMRQRISIFAPLFVLANMREPAGIIPAYVCLLYIAENATIPRCLPLSQNKGI